MILSFPKLVGLLAVVLLVWITFRLFEARQKNGTYRPIEEDESKSAGEAGRSGNETGNTPVDLQECDLCGAWFSGETCERENCPD